MALYHFQDHLSPIDNDHTKFFGILVQSARGKFGEQLSDHRAAGVETFILENKWVSTSVSTTAVPWQSREDGPRLRSFHQHDGSGSPIRPVHVLSSCPRSDALVSFRLPRPASLCKQARRLISTRRMSTPHVSKHWLSSTRGTAAERSYCIPMGWSCFDFPGSNGLRGHSARWSGVLGFLGLTHWSGHGKLHIHLGSGFG